MKRKYFGGYVSLRQAIYLIFAILSVGLFFLPFIDLSVKITLCLITCVICSMFAFLKIDGANADKYFTYIFRFLVRRKIFVLER